MDRRTLLAAGAGLLASPTVFGSPSRAVSRSTKARNVLLLIADDQGLDAGCYGTNVRTPRIDALARSGTRFTQAYAAVSSCSSSRSVIYTGLYTHQNGMYGLQHGVHHQSLLDGIDTIPAMLKRAGYCTALVGKKHVGPDKSFPYDAELVPEREGIRDVAAISQAAAQFIAASGDTPFFVTVGYSDPHRAPGGYGNGSWPGVTPVHYDPARVPIPSHLPDIPAVREDLAAYYESISRLDSGVGMVLDALEKAGHAQDTLVIYLSDNGRPFPGAKTNLYDPGLHLPLIIRAPGAPSGEVSEDMASFVDIVPTILDWTGAKSTGQKLSGQSLLPLLDGRTPGRDAVFASHEFHEINQYYPMRAIRTRTHSFILNLAHPLPYPIAGDVAGSPSWKAIAANLSINLGKRTQTAYLSRPLEELYDLRHDPVEVINIVSDPQASEIAETMRKRLRDWRSATSDPWLEGETNPYGARG